jgi:hypothetical protein
VSVIDMEPRRSLFPKSPFTVILQVGFLNALLVTFTFTVAYALISGAGIEPRTVTTGFGSAHGDVHLSPLEFISAVLWLSPIAAVSCGMLGLLAGCIGGTFMCARARYISAKRFRVETSLVGVTLACLFVLCDILANGKQGSPYTLLYLLAIVLGPVYALISVFIFRQRILRQ